MNKMIIIGHLTADPITREVAGANGVNKVCNFGVAVNMRRNGQEITQFYNVAAWNQLGEPCQRYLTKGRQVYVEGPLTHQLYQANDGTTRVNLNIAANYIEFLSSGNPQNGNQPAGAGVPANAAPAAQPAPAAAPNYGVGQPADPNAGFTPIATDELPF